MGLRPTTFVRGLLGTDPPHPTLKSALPSPPQRSTKVPLVPPPPLVQSEKVLRTSRQAHQGHPEGHLTASGQTSPWTTQRHSQRRLNTSIRGFWLGSGGPRRRKSNQVKGTVNKSGKEVAPLTRSVLVSFLPLSTALVFFLRLGVPLITILVSAGHPPSNEKNLLTPDEGRARPPFVLLYFPALNLVLKKGICTIAAEIITVIILLRKTTKNGVIKRQFFRVMILMRFGTVFGRFIGKNSILQPKSKGGDKKTIFSGDNFQSFWRNNQA